MAENSSQVMPASESQETVSNNQQGDAAANQQPAAARPGMWGMIKTLLIRMVFIYMISSFFRRSSTPASDEPAGPKLLGTNLFPKDTIMDFYAYISEDDTFTDFDNKDALFWRHNGLVYGDWTAGREGDGSFTKSGFIEASENVQANGTLYIHVYFVKAGKSPNPKDKGSYSKRAVVYKSKQLNAYKKRRYHQTVNLLTGQTDVHPDLQWKENMSTVEVISHWHPNLTINMLDDHTPWTMGQIPAPLDEFVEFVPGMDKYYPVVYFNDYWNLNSDFTPINSTTKQLNFTLTYSPISLFRWQMYAAQGMRNKWYNMLGTNLMEESDDDQDSLKVAFLETNPYLLALTIIVSLVHSVFEFLAFKNDIQFWRNRKSLEGLSVRSVFFNVFQSLIVVLYVLDNETNTVVRISVFIGLIIEIWKIHKVVNIKINKENRLFGILPRISFEDKSTYTESQTKKYDTIAFKYLSWLLFPLLFCYSIYSLLYQEHKGWYSWVLNLLYGFLLTFGFIMMTPQLFINYKLKSVAHLPWRMLTYKALNTFIDDIFAFVIKMPTLYRIGCFRDDVIFFIFLYQRYIYRIDPTRLNEFGTSQEMFEQNGITPKDTAETENGMTPKDTADEGNEILPLPAPKSEEAKKND